MDRIQLNKMIDANQVQDCTAEIRAKKHSDKIAADVQRLVNLRQRYGAQTNANSAYDDMCVNQCNFLFNNYTDLFNKVKKDEISLDILAQLLTVLKQIEVGELDQHAGAYEVGKLMKTIYIDSALLKAKKLDDEAIAAAEGGSATSAPLPEPKNISWKEFKASAL
jgi:hypothetical protein